MQVALWANRIATDYKINLDPKFLTLWVQGYNRMVHGNVLPYQLYMTITHP